MDKRTFDLKVRELADKLKQQGIALSDARARQMAEDILKTEQRQSQNYEERSNDPEYNPQQRMSIDNPPQGAQPVIVPDSVQKVDQETPISELLEEAQQTPSPAEPQVVSQPEPATQMAESYQPEVTPQPTEEVMADIPTQSSDTIEVPQEPAEQAVEMPPVQEQKIEMPPAPSEPAQQEVRADVDKSAVEQAFDKSVEQPQKKQQPKVDLTEMFNFSKR